VSVLTPSLLDGGDAFVLEADAFFEEDGFGFGLREGEEVEELSVAGELFLLPRNFH